MSGGTDGGDPVSAEAGGVTVSKTFEAEEFPVPAVKFVVGADGDEPVTVRLSDRIPGSLPMKRVGFHPEFEGENWTAYKDQRVEYVRTLDPGESVTTVYGVRLEGVDTEESEFLEEPTLELVADGERSEGGESDAEAVEAIVGEGGNRIVRDVVSGERDSVPGMDEGDAEPLLDLDDPAADEGGRDDPLAADPADGAPADGAGADPAVGPSGDDPLELEFDDPDRDAAADGDADPVEAAEAGNGSEGGEPAGLNLEAAEADLAGATDAETDGPRVQSTDATPVVVERSGGIERVDAVDPVDPVDAVDAPDAGSDGADDGGDEADADGTDDGGAGAADAEPAPAGANGASAPDGGFAAALATEIRAGDVSDDDLALLRSELDLGGVPSSVDVRLGRLQSRVEDLAAYTDALEAFLDEEGTGEELIAELRGEVDGVSDTVEDLAADLDVAAGEREHLRSDLDDVEARVVAGERELDAVDDEVGDVREELSALDEELDAVRGRVDDVAELDGDVSELRADVDGIQSELGELKEFRDRLGSAFGGDA